MKILFVSLGCDKNLVDTEVMLGLLSEKGYTFTDDEDAADIVVVNTCCFIGDAKEESIQNIWKDNHLDISNFLRFCYIRSANRKMQVASFRFSYYNSYNDTSWSVYLLQR